MITYTDYQFRVAWKCGIKVQKFKRLAAETIIVHDSEFQLKTEIYVLQCVPLK